MTRLLDERGELGTTPGRLMLGILIVQDLSLLLMMAVLPSLASMEVEGFRVVSSIGPPLAKAALFVLGFVVVAVRLVPLVLDRIARTGSHELFLNV
jgi:CPA2 family monovalent cation:H+ antiporter-2